MSRSSVAKCLVLVVVAAGSYQSRQTHAVPNVCDRLCKEISLYMNCPENNTFQLEEGKTCGPCSNSNDTECVDGATKECKTADTEMFFRARKYLGGTPSICNCNTGIKTIEAASVGTYTGLSFIGLYTTCK